MNNLRQVRRNDFVGANPIKCLGCGVTFAYATPNVRWENLRMPCPKCKGLNCWDNSTYPVRVEQVAK